MKNHLSSSIKWQPLLSLLLAMVWTPVRAVVVPAGTFYFDNSKLHYSVVKFVYGNDTENVTHIVPLTETDDGRWKFEIGETASGQTHYFFTNSAIDPGVCAARR